MFDSQKLRQGVERLSDKVIQKHTKRSRAEENLRENLRQHQTKSEENLRQSSSLSATQMSYALATSASSAGSLAWQNHDWESSEEKQIWDNALIQMDQQMSMNQNEKTGFCCDQGCRQAGCHCQRWCGWPRSVASCRKNFTMFDEHFVERISREFL
jgi:hypothetical protein